MPRLTITLPDELRSNRTNTSDRSSEPGPVDSRKLGAGIEGADERSQRLLRWLECWAKSE